MDSIPQHSVPLGSSNSHMTSAPFEVSHGLKLIPPQSHVHITNIPEELLVQIIAEMDGDTVALSEVNQLFNRLTLNDPKISLRATQNDASKEPYNTQYHGLRKTIEGNDGDKLSSITIEQAGRLNQYERVRDAIVQYRDEYNIPNNIFPKVSINSFPDAIFVHVEPNVLNGHIIDRAAKNLSAHIADTLSDSGPITAIHKTNNATKGQITKIDLGSSSKRQANKPNQLDIPYSQQQHNLRRFVHEASWPTAFTVRLTTKAKHSPRALKRAALHSLSEGTTESGIRQNWQPEVSAIKNSTHAVSVRITPKSVEQGIAVGPANALTLHVVNSLAGMGPVKIIRHTDLTGASIADSMRIDVASAFAPNTSQGET